MEKQPYISIEEPSYGGEAHMTWLEKAEEVARQFDGKYTLDYWTIFPKNVVILYQKYHTLVLEDQVGETTPLPLENSLRDMNDFMCAWQYFDAIGILYSGSWRKINNIWCVPLEALLHTPKKILGQSQNLWDSNSLDE